MSDLPGHCPACASARLASLRHQHHWDENGEHYALVQCRDCGWRGTHPMPAPQVLARLYGQDFDYGWYRAHRAAITADACCRLDEVAPFLGRSLLDYGGGHGYLARAARRRGLDAAVHDPYCGSPDPGLLDREWDTVFCLHVLEHVPAPAAAVARMARLLHPGGRLILAVPNAAGQGYGDLGTNWHWFQGPLIHVSHFTPAALCRLVHRCGLHLESVSFHDRWNASTAADLTRRDETRRLDGEWAATRDPAVARRNIRRRFALLRDQGDGSHDDERLAEILLIARKG